MSSRPTVFTINGWSGDMWLGPQADVGRYLGNQGINVAYWQPIGYPSAGFPLSRGLDAGLPELQNQMALHPGPFMIASWSLGSIIAATALERMRSAAPGWPDLSMFKGAVAFGNPYREAGNWAPRGGVGAVPDPGGAGIGGPRNNTRNTPSWWHNYAHSGDLYTCCPTNDIGDDVRIIFDFVLSQWTGAMWDLAAFAQKMVQGPLKVAPGVVWAIIDAIVFYGSSTREHQNYDPHPAMNFLAGIARSL